MRNLFNIPLGACTAPFGSPKKEIFNAFANIISSMINTGNVSATNEANTWNNIITNNMNKQINDDQLAWARENYEMEKAENRFLVDQAYQRELENRAHQEQYNSPAETKQRWIDAGFNPSLMMSPTGLASGNVSSVGSSVGSPPRHNQPNMIPMQQAAPSIPYQVPDGFGIGKDLEFYLASRQSEREDYRLASDITFKDNQMRLDYLRYRMDNSKSGAERKYFEKLTSNLDREMALNEDKFSHQIEWDNFQKEVAEYQVKQKDMEIQIQSYLAENQIAVGNAQIGMLSQQALLYQQEMFNAKQSGADNHQLALITNTYQDKLLDMLIEEGKQRHFNVGTEFRRKYTRFVNWMLDPVKGVISAGANVGFKK